MNDTLELVCKLCVLGRYWNKLPANINEQPRYRNAEVLREHWNTAHEGPDRKWKGTEPIWTRGSAVCEAQAISMGVLIACGDLECTYRVLWCLHCDFETTDPVMVRHQLCPKCGRDYGDAYKKKVSV